MSTRFPLQYNPELDLTHANQMTTEAHRISALIRAGDTIVTGVIKTKTWVGPDALAFARRWADERDRLGKHRAELLVCADGLRRWALTQSQRGARDIS